MPKPKVVLVHRPRSRVPSKTGKDDDKINSGRKDGCMYPSLEGVQHTPLSDRHEKGKEESVDDVLAAALRLNAVDRKLLLARLSLAEQKVTADSRDLQMWTAAVYDTMAAANGLGPEGVPAPMLVKRALAAASSWAAVSTFMAVAKLDTLTVPKRQSVYGLLAELLVAHATAVARNTHAPVSAKFVANCAVNIASIFDHAFPGYVRAGLALVVATRRTEGQPSN